MLRYWREATLMNTVSRDSAARKAGDGVKMLDEGFVMRFQTFAIGFYHASGMA